MKSALEIVAFSNHTETEGTIALLQTALKALDRAGDYMAAAYVDLALRGYMTRYAPSSSPGPFSSKRPADDAGDDQSFDDLQDYG